MKSLTILIALLAITPSLAVARPAPPSPNQTTSPTALLAVLAAEDDLYRSGQRALDDGRWADAAKTFAQVAAAGGPNVDAALYWQAWAEHQAGRKNEATAALDKLISGHPQSPWRDDAEALRLEVTGAARTAKAEKRGRSDRDGGDERELTDQEELKLFAIQSLMSAEPERALPPLRKVLASDSPRQLREQALFVVSQLDSPEATALLRDVARGGSQPDLQMTAIEYLGLTDDPQAMAFLQEIYSASDRRELKAKILESFMIADADSRVLAAARAEKDPELRAKAIELLGVMDANAALRELFRTEPEARVRAKIVESLAIAEDVDFLKEAARDADVGIRRKAIEGLGMQDDAASSAALRAIYRTSDRESKRAVLDAFMMRDDAEGLIEVARAESDRALKRAALERLAMMDSEEAQQFLLDALEK